MQMLGVPTAVPIADIHALGVGLKVRTVPDEELDCPRAKVETGARS